MPKRFVLRTGHPEGVEESGQLTSHGHDGAFLGVLASKFAEFWADADLLGLYQQLGMELKPKETDK
jgi:hypothetical protein